jgi:hypothetical protein
VPGPDNEGLGDEEDEEQMTIVSHEESIIPILPEAERLFLGEEQPLQAMLVADRVTEEADLEAQVQARMRNEAENIADIVQRRILQNTPTALILSPEGSRSEANKAGKTRKKICILAGVLVIVAAIGIALGIIYSNPQSGSEQPGIDRIELFRKALVSVSGETLYDKDSPQYQALDWIANTDPAKISVSDSNPEIIKQRYVAAVLYFALGGNNWTDKYNFLTGDSICEWHNESSGIICDPAKVRVVTLNLCKSNRLRCAMSTFLNVLKIQTFRSSSNSSKQ